jgi:hypothetical protein
MSGVTKAIGTIAGIASIALYFVPGGQVVAGIATAAKLAKAVTAIALVANLGSSLLAKKPPARGSVNNILISPEAPSPYLIGRTYTGGVLRYENARGG